LCEQQPPLGGSWFYTALSGSQIKPPALPEVTDLPQFQVAVGAPSWICF